MRYLIGVIAIALVTFSSCSNADDAAKEKAKQDSLVKIESRMKYVKAITDAEAEMRKTKVYDQKLAMATLKAYNDFTVTFPDDTAAAEYLFLASDLAQGARNYQQAAVYLETILDKHKTYRKYSDAVFVAAFVYDTYLEDVNHGVDRAKQLYQFEIDNYPNSPYASQAKVLIKYLGMPDSVMINDIINKGQADAAKQVGPSGKSGTTNQINPAGKGKVKSAGDKK